MEREREIYIYICVYIHIYLYRQLFWLFRGGFKVSSGAASWYSCSYLLTLIILKQRALVLEIVSQNVQKPFMKDPRHPVAPKASYVEAAGLTRPEMTGFWDPKASLWRYLDVHLSLDEGI